MSMYDFDKIELEGLSERIFLDRYALKELDKTKWKVGARVVAIVSENPDQPLLRQTVTATIREIDLENDHIVVETDQGDTYEITRRSLEYPIEVVPHQMWDRVAQSLASVERPEIREAVYQDFAYALNDWKLVPGGRVNAGAGTNDLTLMNCFVIDSPHDSRGGIFKTALEMVEIMSRGGGVGINLSTLRPRRAIVNGVNGHSSGSISWGGLYSYTTGLVEQGGSRRGALMLMLNDWHPDLLEFITIKQTSGLVTNANLSVCVSDAFMNAVKEDGEWLLEFPLTTHPNYDTEWDGDLKKWKEKGYPTEVHSRHKARDIWNVIIESAWKSAEPGIVFMDMYNDFSNSWYFNRIIATNPCGEQGLPGWGVCNLSAINLSKFYDEDKHDVDWDDLAKIIHIGVRICDNVTDYTMYPLPQQKENQSKERRSGLGTMGLAELLIKLNIRYGSPESLVFLDKLYGFIAKEAYLASSNLAEEKGSFHHFEYDKFIQSKFMQNLIGEYPEVGETIRQKGMRNVTVITQAPTGSTGTMVGTSTGIEPYFAFEYFRQGRLGTDKQYVPIAQRWLVENPGKELPEWFVTAQDLSAEDHVRVQAVIQKWTDSSISKTANAPHDFTIQDTADLYELAHDLGCKGVTIYRDGSRDIQVLSTVKEKEKEAPLGREKAEITQNVDDFESSKICSIREENGQRIIECSVE